MKAKDPRGGYTPLHVGIHAVVIHSIKYAKENDGSDKVTVENGQECRAIEIKYKDDEKREIDQQIWIKESTQWVIDKILNTIGLRESEVSVTKAIGKKLWIKVGILRACNEFGELLYETPEVVDFFPLGKNGIKPAVLGDPEKNNGIPSHTFVRDICIKSNGESKTTLDN